MQFEQPSFLYFLLFLLVPILVHLFQLQRFKKVAFTNVAFLQKITQQSRKSSALKKWLLLTFRLLLFGALILAFCRPYFPAENQDLSQKTTRLYLDNSLSLNSKGEKGVLLPVFAQEILENASKESMYSLLTNDEFYKNIDYNRLSSVLKNIEFSANQKKISQIVLEANEKNNKLTKGSNEILLISDFQNFNKNDFTDVNSLFSVISQQPQSKNNVSIDDLRVVEQSDTNVSIELSVTNHGNEKVSLPFSLLVNKKLTNKKVVVVAANADHKVRFSFQKSPEILGQIVMDIQDSFLFDNQFFFTLDFRSKIRVLSIGEKASYIDRIFDNTEFLFTHTPSTQIDYNAIPNQQLIILNELAQIPESLNRALVRFSQNGGTVLWIPATSFDSVSYNRLMRSLQMGNLVRTAKDTLQITNIAFDHPLFSDVFSKRVNNFEYPQTYQRMILKPTGIPVLSYANNDMFMSQYSANKGSIYWFSSAINPQNSNFTRSPLIVPTLYNVAYQSLALPQAYYEAGTLSTVQVPISLGKDEVLSLTKNNQTYIPRQESQFNRTQLELSENIQHSGFYAITRNTDTIGHIAVNYKKEESTHNYLDVFELAKNSEKVRLAGSISEYFNELQQKNQDHKLWKLFLAIAIVSLLFEILIVKFFKT